jgi:hypothetical protein
MPKLFNKESGEEEIVGFDKVNEAVLSGKYRFGSAQVPLLHPRGDDIYLFPAEKAEEIMRDNNYRFPDKQQTTSFYERLDADIASAEKEADLEEKYGDRDFAATGLGLLRGVSIGLSDPALIKSGLFSQEELREIEERNEAASVGGEIVGAVAPALIPGYGALTLSGLAARGSTAIGRRLAGEAAKKSLGRVATSYGVAGAIEGGAYGIGQTISEEALGRGEATAEAYVANVRMGALLGFGGGFFLGGSANMMGRIARSAQEAKKFKKDALINAKNDGLDVDINDTRRLEEIMDSDNFIKYAPRDKNGKIKSGGFGRNIKDKIFVGAELATGADKKLLDEFFSVSPQGAKLRANATMSQTEKFKMTDDYVNEMVKKYNLNERLIKMMTGGEKYIMMRKALEEVDQKVALDAVEDYIIRSYMVLDDMKARPTEYSKELYIPKVQRAIEQLEADLSSATSSFQIFKILDEAKKKTIDKWMRYGKNLQPIEEETIRHLREKVRNPLKNLLESEEVFGKAGTMQKKINKTASSYYDFVDNFNKNFSEKVTVGGEKVPKIAEQKIVRYLTLRGRYHATASQRKLSGAGGQNELFQQQRAITGLAQDLAPDSPAMARTLSGMDVGDQQIMDDVVTIFTQHNQKRQSSWDDLVMGKERMAVTDEMKKIRESIDASAKKLEDIEKAMSAEQKLKDLVSDGIRGTGSAVNMMQKLDQVIRYTRNKINKQMRSFVKPAGNAASGVFRGTAAEVEEITGRPVKSEKKEKEDFKKKKDEISSLVADPTMMVVRLSENLGELPDAAPNASFHIGQTVNRAIQYASSKIPRSPMEGMWMTAEQPEPSNDQMAAFRNVMRAIEDPLVLGDQLANGLIIPETLDTVKNVYPFIYEQMKSELLKQVTASPIPINFHQQALVSKFVGVSNPMTRQTAGLQSTWTGLASQPIKKKTNKVQNLDSLMQTPLQRVNVV